MLQSAFAGQAGSGMRRFFSKPVACGLAPAVAGVAACCAVSTLQPALTWSAASDGYGSGVAKYHLRVFENWGLFLDKVDKDVTGTSYALTASEALQ